MKLKGRKKKKFSNIPKKEFERLFLFLQFNFVLYYSSISIWRRKKIPKYKHKKKNRRTLIEKARAIWV
jgi:hypothetical protein